MANAMKPRERLLMGITAELVESDECVYVVATDVEPGRVLGFVSATLIYQDVNAARRMIERIRLDSEPTKP